MITSQAPRSLRWHHYVIGAAVLASPCISGCATTPAAAPAVQASAPAELPPLPPAALTLDAIVAMARGGQKADALVEQIRSAGAFYRLSAAEVLSLAKKGLPLPVIDHILTSERQFSAGLARPAPDRAMPVQTPPRRPIPALYLGV